MYCKGLDLFSALLPHQPPGVRYTLHKPSGEWHKVTFKCSSHYYFNCLFIFPQCLFPLVSRSLEDVLARLVPVELAVGKKRKKTQDEEELIKRSPKQLRLNELDSFRTESVTETLVNQAAIRNEQVLAQETDGGKVNGNDRILDCGVTEKETIQSHHDLVKVTESATSASDGHPQSSTEALLTSNGDEPLLLQHCGTLGVSVMNDDSRLESYKHIHSVEINGPSPPLIEPYVQDKQKSQTCTLPTCENKDGIKSNTEEFSSPSAAISEELVSVPDKIFWWNADNLCWLDSLLVALVKCRSLRRRKPKDEPQHSSVWQLINRYEAICAAVEAHHQTGRGELMMILQPSHPIFSIFFTLILCKRHLGWMFFFFYKCI